MAGRSTRMAQVKADASKLATARKLAGLRGGRDLDELAQSLPADIKSYARSQRGGESGTGVYRPGRRRGGRCSTPPWMRKAARDKAAKRGLLVMGPAAPGVRQACHLAHDGPHSHGLDGRRTR